MEVLPPPPNEAHVMADAPHVISNDEDINSEGTNVESAVSNGDLIAKKEKLIRMWMSFVQSFHTLQKLQLELLVRQPISLW